MIQYRKSRKYSIEFKLKFQQRVMDFDLVLNVEAFATTTYVYTKVLNLLYASLKRK